MADQSKPADVTGVTDPDERSRLIHAFTLDYLAVVRKHGIGLHHVVEGQRIGYCPLDAEQLQEYEHVFLGHAGSIQ